MTSEAVKWSLVLMVTLDFLHLALTPGGASKTSVTLHIVLLPCASGRASMTSITLHFLHFPCTPDGASTVAQRTCKRDGNFLTLRTYSSDANAKDACPAYTGKPCFCHAYRAAAV